jgi:hypothetical protein
MTDAPRRWIYAHMQGLGDVVFESSESFNEGSVKAYRLCLLTVSRNEQGAVVDKNVQKFAGYAHGIMRDPIILGESAFIMACLAPKDLAHAAESAWSNILRPNNGRFPGRGA